MTAGGAPAGTLADTLFATDGSSLLGVSTVTFGEGADGVPELLVEGKAYILPPEDRLFSRLRKA